MNKTGISVVMTTWNGKEHVTEQMESLRKQTLQPDEVLILDDVSTDGTPEIVSSFIAKNSLSNWILEINSENLGWKRNFIKGIRKAKGGWIFLCDQDDIWYPEKIEEMVKAISGNDRILLLACDYHVVYQPGAIRATVYKKSRKEAEGTTGQYTFRKRFFMNPNPGCTYVMRREFVRESLDYWIPEAPHDEFFWLMATFQDGAFFHNKVLMDYIRYAQNASGVRFKDVEMQLQHLAYVSKMLDQLEAFAKDHPGKVAEKKREELKKAKTWCQKRKQLMETRNPFRWLAMMPYWGYYNSPRNCLSDPYLVLFGSFRRRNL